MLLGKVAPMGVFFFFSCSKKVLVFFPDCRSIGGTDFLVFSVAFIG